MIIVKATKDSEAGIMPDQKLMDAMGGVQRGARQGRHPRAARRGPATELEGRARHLPRQQAHRDRRPFAETKELIAGFWIWNVKSKDEAIEWVKRCPNPMPGESEIEIRQVFEAEDFGAEFTPEHREKVERMRAEFASRAR
jgi:hypothetical protein